jgi:hypothetical protein
VWNLDSRVISPYGPFCFPVNSPNITQVIQYLGFIYPAAKEGNTVGQMVNLKSRFDRETIMAVEIAHLWGLCKYSRGEIERTVNFTYEISRTRSIKVKVGCSQLETILTTLHWKERTACHR